MAKLNNQLQWTRSLTPLTDKHYSLDSEDDSAQVVETSVTNNWSFQNFTVTLYELQKSVYCGDTKKHATESLILSGT